MGKPQRTYACTGHDGVYLGGYSVVRAVDEDEARRLLDEQLIAHGLKPYAESPYTLQQVKPNTAVVLWNGDY